MFRQFQMQSTSGREVADVLAYVALLGGTASAGNGLCLPPVEGHIPRDERLGAAQMRLAPVGSLGLGLLVEPAFAGVAGEEEAAGVRHAEGGIVCRIDCLDQAPTHRLLLDQLTRLVPDPQRRVALGLPPSRLVPWASVNLLPGRSCTVRQGTVRWGPV